MWLNLVIDLVISFINSYYIQEIQKRMGNVLFEMVSQDRKQVLHFHNKYSHHNHHRKMTWKNDWHPKMKPHNITLFKNVLNPIQMPSTQYLYYIPNIYYFLIQYSIFTLYIPEMMFDMVLQLSSVNCNGSIFVQQVTSSPKLCEITWQIMWK